MNTITAIPLAQLYGMDETAWLDEMARLAADRRVDELDCENLSEYLQSMASRDRRAVRRRMILLMLHLLKWEHQPEKRSTSWVRTIRHQRDELRQELTSETLRAYVESNIGGMYAKAREDAAAETGLPFTTFPAAPLHDVDELLMDDASIRVV